MNVPEHLQYTKTHEWLRLDGDTATVGITDHAQEELTDIVHVELPKVGANLTAAQPAAVVESVKAASDIYSPIGGAVTEVNGALDADPGLVNRDPYGEGWLFRLSIEAGEQIETLLEAAQYKELISTGGSPEV
jgi:glycine cleavage system H protein